MNTQVQAPANTASTHPTRGNDRRGRGRGGGRVHPAPNPPAVVTASPNPPTRGGASGQGRRKRRQKQPRRPDGPSQDNVSRPVTPTTGANPGGTTPQGGNHPLRSGRPQTNGATGEGTPVVATATKTPDSTPAQAVHISTFSYPIALSIITKELERKYPGVVLACGGVRTTHPRCAISRDFLEAKCIASLRPAIKNGYIVDIGGNPVRHHMLRRQRIHSLNPLVDVKDIHRADAREGYFNHQTHFNREYYYTTGEKAFFKKETNTRAILGGLPAQTRPRVVADGDGIAINLAPVPRPVAPAGVDDAVVVDELQDHVELLPEVGDAFEVGDFTGELAYMLIHSIYYITPETLTYNMYKNKVRSAAAVVHHFPEACGKINDNEASYMRYHNTTFVDHETRIKMSFGKSEQYDHVNVDWLHTSEFFEMTLARGKKLTLTWTELASVGDTVAYSFRLCTNVVLMDGAQYGLGLPTTEASLAPWSQTYKGTDVYELHNPGWNNWWGLSVPTKQHLIPIYPSIAIKCATKLTGRERTIQTLAAYIAVVAREYAEERMTEHIPFPLIYQDSIAATAEWSYVTTLQDQLTLVERVGDRYGSLMTGLTEVLKTGKSRKFYQRWFNDGLSVNACLANLGDPIFTNKNLRHFGVALFILIFFGFYRVALADEDEVVVSKEPWWLPYLAFFTISFAIIYGCVRRRGDTFSVASYRSYNDICEHVDRG